jgi:RecA/RadA recombinase
MTNLATTQPLWIDTAEDAAEGMHNPKLYIGGGLAGGLILGSLLNPLTGIAALAYGIYLAWDANERNSDQIEAVGDGLVAHLLDKKHLRQYQVDVGGDRVQAELAQAIARELSLSDDAEKLAKSLGLLGKNAPAAPPQLPPAASENTASLPAPIGASALPVAATPIGPQQWDEDEVAIAPTATGILQDCLAYPTILIYGPQGSGKSTLAHWLIQQRIAAGHHCEILDPHAAYGAWEGLPLYGAGMNYQACDDRLVAFADLVKSRYQVLSTKPNFNPQPHTLLTEEFTNWAQHCPHAGQFFGSSMSDLRKVNMFAVYVAHGRTLTSLGGKAGVAEQRDQTLLEIELSAIVGPGGKAMPSGKANVYYPGQKNTPIAVEVPTLELEQPANNQGLESAYSADSSNDEVAIIREVLIKANEPLLASQIRQKHRALKDGVDTKALEQKLERMAHEGFIDRIHETPPKYAVS